MRSYPFSRRCSPLHPHYLLISIAAFLVPLLAHGQSTGRVTGVVIDVGTRSPLTGATVSLRDAADSAAQRFGDVTDKDGKFTIERVPLGQVYTLEARYVGYEKQVVEKIILTAEKPNLNLGELLLQQGEINRGEVTVTSQRPNVTVLADKTVYAVESNPTYTATNVSELLGQIPTVEVDQDGKVSLRGNDAVTIMMNDRPLTMPADQRNKFLQSLPANMVKDIEIRTNPGAQFDARNGGGIINIVTRRTMSDMFGGNLNSGIDSRVGVNGGGGLYYNGSDLTASLGGGIHHGPGEGSTTSLRVNYLDTNERRDVGSGSSNSGSNSSYGYGQIDYKITEKDLASLSFNLNNWSSDYTSHSAHTFFDARDVVVGRYFDSSAPNGTSANSGGYNSASLLFKHTFDGDHKLSLDASYNSNGYSGGNDYSSTYFEATGELDSVRSATRNTTYDRSNSTIITTLDYENPLSEKLSLSFGAKNEINKLDNRTEVSSLDRATGVMILDTMQTSHYLPENTIYALYSNVSYRPMEALSLQAGVRVERANVAAEYESGESIISKEYTNLFPSGSIAYNLSEQQSLTFSYRRSIALPDIDALNPTRLKWSDFYEYSGNPDLNPEFTQSLELNYNMFWGAGNMFTVAPYYSTTDGNIESSQQLLDGVTHSSYENFNGVYTIGSQASLAMKPLPWLNFRTSADLYRKVNRGSATPGDIYSEASGYSGNASLNADLLEGMTLSMSVYFTNPATVGGSRNSGYTYMNFSLRQRLLDKKLTLSLRVNDPFNLQKWENVYDSPEFHTESTSNWSSRFVGLNITYTFGTTPRMEQHKQEKTETKGSGGSGGGSGGGGGQ